MAVAALSLTGMVPSAFALASDDLPKSAAESTDDFQANIQAGYAALTHNDFSTAAGLLASVKNSLRFAALPAQARYSVLRNLALCEDMTGRHEPAFTDLMAAEQAVPGPYDAGHYLIKAQIAQALHKSDVLLDAMIAVSGKYPDVARTLPYGIVEDALDQADSLKDAQKLQRQLLENLRAAGYVSQDIFQDPEDLRFQLFQIYVDQGVDAGADSLMAEFKSPKTIIRLRADKRYQRFVEADAKSGLGRTDFKTVLDAWVEQRRQMSASHPRQLDGVNVLADALIVANRLDEAQTVIDTALNLIKSAPKDKPPYDDLATHYNWLLDIRSRLLLYEGKTADIAAAKETASTVAKQQNADPVSQTLNLGAYYVSVGQPQKALDAIRDYPSDRASPYGRMVAAQVRVCAYAQLGQKEQMEADLQDMTSHAHDSMAVMRSALACANDKDRLAALLIANLDDPETRNDTLLYLQHYLPLPYASEAERKVGVMTAEVLKQSDVSAVVAKYGTIDSYPIYWTGNW